MPYVFALTAAALYGVGDFLGGLVSRRASVFTVGFVTQVAGLLGLVVALPFFPSAAPSGRDLAWGAAAGIAASVGLALLYRGLATGTASVVAPVTAVCAIAVPVLAEFVAGVRPASLVRVGIVTAMAAVVLLSQSGGGAPAPAPATGAAPGDEAKPRTRGIALAIASGVAIGLFLTCLARTNSASGLWPLLASRFVAVIGFGVVCLARSLPLVPPVDALRPSVASGVLDVAANVLYLIAVRAGTLGPIATLVSLYPASTVALAGIVWRERLRPVQNAGLVLAFVAIVLITWRTP